ncbi:MAG TPA: hypothetical protein PKU80_08100 [Candidatus Limiplasma sp.]|nr:hypothetical protein [Candidatus Limiplasma sp.]
MNLYGNLLNRSFVIKKQMLYFFVPLAISNALITVTHSLYLAGIARLSQPELYLAAFAVAKSMYQTLQFPTATSRQCITGLSHDGRSFLTARNFYLLMLGFVSLIFAIIAFTPVSYYLFTVVMGNPPQVAHQAALTLRFFVILPAIFCVRDIYGSLAIRLRQTRILFVGTLSRVVLSCLIILVITKIQVSWDSIIPGMIFLLTGITEAAAVYLGTKKRLTGYIVRLNAMPIAGKDRTTLTNKGVAHYAIPVFAMALIQSLVGTFINSGLARTISPELAIATFAVAWTIVMSINTASGMFHQVILNFMEDDYSNRQQIIVFSVHIAVVLALLMFLIGFTPLGYWLMNTLIGTSPVLSQMGVAVIRTCVVLPVLSVIRQYYWGIAMKTYHTVWLTIGSAVQLSAMVLIIILLTLLRAFPSNPAIIGSVAVTGSMFFECLYLYAQKRKITAGKTQH